MVKAPFRKIKIAIVPIGNDNCCSDALAIAKALAEEVILVGVVKINEGEPVSGGNQAARKVRKRLMELREDPAVRFKSTVVVSETPWKDMLEVITHEKPELLVVEWKNDTLSSGLPMQEVLSNSLVNVLVVRGTTTHKFEKTLVAVRGGPHAELALQVGLNLHPAQLDVLHLSISGVEDEAPFKGYKRILSQIPEINPRSITTDDVAKTLFEEATAYDLVILGTSANSAFGGPSIGPVAARLLRENLRRQ